MHDDGVGSLRQQGAGEDAKACAVGDGDFGGVAGGLFAEES